jgi:hypothetical protein
MSNDNLINKVIGKPEDQPAGATGIKLLEPYKLRDMIDNINHLIELNLAKNEKLEEMKNALISRHGYYTDSSGKVRSKCDDTVLYIPKPVGKV